MRLVHEGWPWRRTDDGRTVIDLVPRWLRLLLGAVLLGGALAALGVRTVGHDPTRWHVDPLTAERTGKPNDFLAAPAGMTAAVPDRSLGVLGDTATGLMASLHEVAIAAPRTTVVAGRPEELFVTYVQRSAVMGFPDYVSVRAVAIEGGATLAIWSRARFGRSDFGVNAARVRRWLAVLEAG